MTMIAYLPRTGAAPAKAETFLARGCEMLSRWTFAASRAVKATTHRRELAALSDRQLRDAGIDLTAAGRGKAAAANAATLRRLQSLSFG